MNFDNQLWLIESLNESAQCRKTTERIRICWNPVTEIVITKWEHNNHDKPWANSMSVLFQFSFITYQSLSSFEGKSIEGKLLCHVISGLVELNAVIYGTTINTQKIEMYTIDLFKSLYWNTTKVSVNRLVNAHRPIHRNPLLDN